MLIQQDDFSIEILPDEKKVTITGTMRLSSPLAYEEFFSGITNLISTADHITIDISKLEFLNSSGLTSLGRLFMQAKGKNISGKVIASKEIPWHQRSIVSISKLWANLEVVII